MTNWLCGHAVGMIVATIFAVITGSALPVVVMMCVSMTVFVIGQREYWLAIHPFGGYANHVTLARFLLLVFTLLLSDRVTTAWFVGSMVFVMIADGIDGYLARRLGTTTEFGAVFDMEVDAFLALALSFVLWQKYPASWWLLPAGLLRYLFCLLYWVLDWHHRKRPGMPESKFYAVLFFIGLLVPWIMPWTFAKWFAAVGCVIVGLSFAKEFYLMRQTA